MSNKSNHFKIYFLSCIALLTIGFSFSIRSSIAGDLQSLFNSIDPINSSKMVGSVLGVAFLGYAFTIFLGSPLIDAIGMGLLLKISALLIVLGTLLVSLAETWFSSSLYTGIWTGMFIIGIGWGLVDAVTNPLLATLYPDEKTHKLKVLHAWWPGGIMLGGLLGLLAGQIGWGWQAKLYISMVPAVIYGLLCFGSKFPLSERAAAGVSWKDMCLEIFRRPMFFVWFLAMFLTSASELAPGQWIDMTLTRTVGIRGIWLLIYVSGMMFVMRHFAGPLAKRFSPVGLLWVSCLLTAAGLLALSFSTNPLVAILSATLWGVGVCYLWPTMLASVSERYPKAGALGLGLMGTAGTLSIYFMLPILGKIYDSSKIEYAGGEESFTQLAGEALESALSFASQHSFRFVSLLPCILLVTFGVVWLMDKKMGGFKPEQIT